MELGAVLTATELEGCHPAADWSLWIRRGRAPAPDARATDAFRTGWADDLDQLVALGIGSVQVTLEWAALEPRPGHHDADALEARRQILAGARERGLAVWGCLVDGTLPGWFADDEGGFSDDRGRNLLWPRHIDWVGEHLGDLVDGWVPQREGIAWALRRHLLGEAPPGGRDVKTAAEAVRAAVLADGEAWRLLQGTAPVATYQTVRPIRATADDVKAAPRAAGLEALLWQPWLTALTSGRLAVGDLPVRDTPHLRGAFDRVIVEVRPGVEVDGDGRWHPFPADGRRGPTGWVAWPEVMAEALHRAVEELPDRPIVAAGSLADVADDGRARPDHLRAMLDAVADLGPADHEATTNGLRGWWHTSPISGYHWRHGHDLSPGVIDADRSEAPAAEELRRRAPTSNA
ncbi:MAG: family 1 glycosylhydrolase [Actinomycetota bacterium]